MEVLETAVGDEGSTFAGWSGACPGTENCIVTMDTAYQRQKAKTLCSHGRSLVLKPENLAAHLAMSTWPNLPTASIPKVGRLYLFGGCDMSSFAWLL